MYKRAELRIKLYDFQKMIDDFTMAGRPFTSYLQNKLEYITMFYIQQMRPENNGGFGWKFARVDTENDEVVFLGPPELDLYSAAMKGIEGIRVSEINRPLDIRLLKP